MKKTITIAVLTVVLSLFAVTVNAATVDDVMAYVKDTHVIAGEEVKLSESQVLRVERYFEEYPITEAHGDALLAKLDEIKATLDEADVKDLNSMSSETKNTVLALANEAADIVGVTLAVDSENQSVSVIKDGKVLDTVSITDEGKLSYTGSSVNVYVLAASIVIIAGIVLIAKKGLIKNAR